jgi:formylglycine-generating enzyme required for sulfatase activity
VGVNWDDAQGFCQWLTAAEQAEGKLPKEMKYRLPTDEEWSWAVGLPTELGSTPAEKSQKNTLDFPWGRHFPPPKKMGNYADESFHAKFPSKKNEKESRMDNQWIEGYDDGYATTSPAGTFPANAYGLCDMGGNVWQWCEDWFDVSHKGRVQRGASWNTSDSGALLSSYRNVNPPAHRYDNGGFRCVLGTSAR